ncbi:MAG: hypothetical protein KDI13_04485 [Alphaproteobacteria bacterium]|nr:hypothetical protein [Alphaproteobacteria bacterium]
MANQYLSLALFLMLLSFFIIMNGVSGFEETKAHPVMNSIALAFSNKPGNEDRAPDDQINKDFVIGEGDALSQIEGLFNAEVIAFESVRNRFGTTMHVQVPVLEFERAIDVPRSSSTQPLEQGNAYTKGRGAFLPTLVSLLKADKRGMPYRMDMILALDNNPADETAITPKLLEEKVEKIGALAGKLERAGLPQKFITAGLGQGKSGFIDLYFSPWEPIVTENDIKGEAPQ